METDAPAWGGDTVEHTTSMEIDAPTSGGVEPTPAMEDMREDRHQRKGQMLGSWRGKHYGGT